MENRFTLKDFVIVVLLIAVIVMIALSMKQFDRQYAVIRDLQNSVADQNRTLNDINNQLASGIRTKGMDASTGAGSPTRAADKNDPFARLKTAATQPGYSRGDWYIEAFPAHLSKITPFTATDRYAEDVQSHIFEGLLSRDPQTLNFMPLIAESWEYSPDGMNITCHLRHNVKFSDGEPCNADDVVWSFNWIMNPKVEAPRERGYYEKITAIEKIDDFTIVAKFKEPYFNELVLLSGLYIMPKHFYGKYSPEDYNRIPGLMMGTGPYRMESPTDWTPGKPLVLVRNDRYWGTPSGVDRIIFRELENEVARQTTFTNGDIDYLNYLSTDVFNKMLENKELVARTQHYASFNPIQGYTFLGWNENRAGKPTVFADKRVRRAMTYLLDRQRISHEIYSDYYIPSDGPFYPFGKQHAPDIKPMPYDPDAGFKLLQEAGFAKTPDGTLHDPAGQQFRFKLTYPTGRATTQRMVLFVKDALAKLGIVVEPDPLDWSVFDERLKNHDFDVITLGWSGVPEDDPYQIFHSSQIADRGDDFISYKNPELDKLIEQARSTVDESTRMPLWHKCHHIIDEDQPYTFLLVAKQLAFADKRFRNIQVTATGLNPLDEWWVPSNERKWQK